jgi:hypothetical protein
MGPLGWKDTEDIFEEDDLVLISNGRVKPVRQLREGEVLVRFNGQPGTPQWWTVMKMEWLRRDHHRSHLDKPSLGTDT